MSGVKTARKLRQDQTKPEAMFWAAVRNRQFLNLKWRRQVPVDKYVADFLCENEKLIVELDGSQHSDEAARRYDQQRTKILERYGYRVIRFWNAEITENLDEVLRLLQQCVGQRLSPHPTATSKDVASTSPQGEVKKPQPL